MKSSKVCGLFLIFFIVVALGAYSCGKKGGTGGMTPEAGGPVGPVFVIEPKFEGAYPFSEGLAMVKVGKAVGYIDKTGRYIRIL